MRYNIRTSGVTIQTFIAVDALPIVNAGLTLTVGTVPHCGSADYRGSVITAYQAGFATPLPVRSLR